jgi:hypothetical protein
MTELANRGRLVTALDDTGKAARQLATQTTAIWDSPERRTTLP